MAQQNKLKLSQVGFCRPLLVVIKYDLDACTEILPQVFTAFKMKECILTLP